MPLSQAQMVQQQQAQAHATELAKRRSRKPTDKTMPEGVEDCVVNADSVQRYKDLRDLERRLDATMTRKRLDIVDSASRNAKVWFDTVSGTPYCPPTDNSPLKALQNSSHLDKQHGGRPDLAG
jgi:hypothetical protein